MEAKVIFLYCYIVVSYTVSDPTHNLAGLVDTAAQYLVGLVGTPLRQWLLLTSCLARRPN